MKHSLNHFQKSMIDFELSRNSQIISTIKGLKTSYEGKNFIEVAPNTDIQVGDILTNSNINYYIDSIDTQTWKGQIQAIKAFYHQ